MGRSKRRRVLDSSTSTSDTSTCSVPAATPKDDDNPTAEMLRIRNRKSQAQSKSGASPPKPSTSKVRQTDSGGVKKASKSAAAAAAVPSSAAAAATSPSGQNKASIFSPRRKAVAVRKGKKDAPPPAAFFEDLVANDPKFVRQMKDLKKKNKAVDERYKNVRAQSVVKKKEEDTGQANLPDELPPPEQQQGMPPSLHPATAAAARAPLSKLPRIPKKKKITTSTKEETEQRVQEAEEEENEPMDWDDFDPGLLRELHSCRQHLESIQGRGGDEFGASAQTHQQLPIRPAKLKGDPTYVVVDTNVFISDLRQIERLMLEDELAVVYIAWSVTRELDHLKDADKRVGNPNPDLAKKARRAIDFINQKLTNKSAKLCGQSGHEERQAEVYRAHNADDRILQACLKLKADGKKVVMFTNDKNLGNRAMVSKVSAHSSKGIRDGLRSIVKPDVGAATASSNDPTYFITPLGLPAPPPAQLTAAPTAAPAPELHPSFPSEEVESMDTDSDPVSPPSPRSDVTPAAAVAAATAVTSPTNSVASSSSNASFSKSDLESILQPCLEKILVAEMKQLAPEPGPGKKNDPDLWKKIVKIPPSGETPPLWSIGQLFKCFDKHWRAVFGMIDGFRGKQGDFFKLQEFFGRSARSVNKAMKESQRAEILRISINILRLFLQHSTYEGAVETALNQLEEMEVGEQPENLAENMGKVQAVFNEIWQVVAQYVYLHLAMVETAWPAALGQPPIVTFSQFNGRNQCRSHLKELTSQVTILTDTLCRALEVPADLLTVRSPQLVSLNSCLASLLPKLESIKPAAGAADHVINLSLPPLSLRLLKDFLVIPDTRAMVTNGFTQIDIFLSQLRQCQDYQNKYKADLDW